MPKIMTDEAFAIAAKLRTHVPAREGRQPFAVQVDEGSKHMIVKIRYGNVLVGQYGIRRGSKQQGHDHVPSQIHMSKKQSYDFAKCTLSVDDYIDVLEERGEIQAPDQDDDANE